MQNVYTVSAINQYIKGIFTEDQLLSQIYVKGEVSNCKYHTSGHIYFTLKDRQSTIAGVMFAGARRGLNFKLSEGQQVIALGSVSVYERDGRYQLYARQMILDGAGLLYQKYEALKADLSRRGYFDADHKVELPKYPKVLGIVTAKTGAAIQDIINVSRRRNPYIQLVLCPALVQGDGAAQSVAGAIETLEAYGVDVMIVGRGGGSIEDLWAFNEEIVAQAIYNCGVPVISAVGHETDVTIADHVADLRAPTPSAAAELAVPDMLSVFRQLEDCDRRLKAGLLNKVAGCRSQVTQLGLRLKHHSPEQKILDQRQQLLGLEERMAWAMERTLKARRHQLDLYIERLSGLSPLKKLNSGFGYVTDDRDRPLTSIVGLEAGQQISVALTDGSFHAEITEIKGEHPWQKEKV